ncbi:LLM class flavin-dependent oxidoreductase [Lapillicoccus jejuensis]|uniref:LLM class flavin-dependent oxidoreductase n=1 Tax=Lapillicoccus jejuensis TaxID=402171 RepID=UPI001FE243AE|nr:LLM class flavin-dependent oxidoreductase [Lapillicoccus jejuensis]
MSAAPPETRPRVGVIVPPSLPAERLVPFVRRVEELGFDELWVVEDCFLHGGVAQAATALAVTQRLDVGLGVLPVGARNVAYAALEVATLAGLHPGRLTVGVGHGMASWNDQVGATVASPLTLLGEYLDALRALLRGEEVTTAGRYVALDHVRLAHPPRTVPPLLAGVRGPRSMEVAAQHADGVLLAEPTTPEYVASVRSRVGPDATLVAYQVASVAPEADGAPGEAAAIGAVRPALRFVADPAWAPHLVDLPFADDLAAHVAAAGSVDEAVATLPAAWVRQLAVAGTAEQARTRLAEVAGAGVRSQALYPVGDDPAAALDALAPLVHP